MEVPVYNMKGEVAGQAALEDFIFNVPFNESLVHQALLRQQANQRQGTADTKTRGEVTGSNRKLFAQKHTGRARRGDVRSPLLRHGGVVFGPHPRDYTQAMPKKMRQLAIRCVLSEKVREGQLKVVDKLEFETPKTKVMSGFLDKIETGIFTLVATAKVEPNMVKAAANLPGVKTTLAAQLNVVDLLDYQTLIVTQAAIEKINEIWGETQKAEAAGVA